LFSERKGEKGGVPGDARGFGEAAGGASRLSRTMPMMVSQDGKGIKELFFDAPALIRGVKQGRSGEWRCI
jgi:hypothetical protein